MNLIVCANNQGFIGKGNDLLYHFSTDLKRFKELTSDSTNGIPHIVMGRKTFDSIGKPLPNRRNIVISRTVKDITGCEVMILEDFITKYKDHPNMWVLGGSEIYNQLLQYCNKVYLTSVIDSSYRDDNFIEIKNCLNKIQREFKSIGNINYFQDLDKVSNKEFVLAFIELDRIKYE